MKPKSIGILLLVTFCVACGGGSNSPTAPGLPSSSPTPTPTPTPSPTPTPLVLAPIPEGAGKLVKRMFLVGDTGYCPDLRGTREIAAYLRKDVTADDIIVLLGDLGYESEGFSNEIAQCLGEIYGDEFFTIIYPVLGNHEYYRTKAAFYFNYFKERAHPETNGYYAVLIGDSWLTLMLNSNSDYVDTSATSPQYRFVKDTLDAHPTRNVVAFWHHPVVSSGQNGDQSAMWDIWKLLVDRHADVVVAAHDHLYERFGLLNRDRQPVSQTAGPAGTRFVIAGTGGALLYRFVTEKPGSEKRIPDKWGVLRLELFENAYRWAFYSTSGELLDTGAELCR